MSFSTNVFRFVVSPAQNIIGAFTLVLFFCGLGNNNITAQAIPVAPALPITTDAYTHNDWKIPSDYALVVDEELIVAATLLSNPNNTPEQDALYTGYDRMLAYMKADLLVNEPTATIAANAYKKVQVEAKTDPKLILMKASEFDAFYEALVIKLHY